MPKHHFNVNNYASTFTHPKPIFYRFYVKFASRNCCNVLSYWSRYNKKGFMFTCEFVSYIFCRHFILCLHVCECLEVNSYISS